MTRLISPVVPTLSATDTGTRALELMEEHKLEHLPLIVDEHFIALVREDELIEWATPDNMLEGSDLLTFRPAIVHSAHPYEALRIITQMDIDVLPVINSEQRYLGAITRDSLLKYISESSGYEAPGGIIVLEIEARNYSLYEIARICENEDVTILNSQTFTTPEGKIEVTIKTNRTALEAVVSSFERHDYKVQEVYGDKKGMEDVMDKYNLLMNYLNM